MKHRSVKEKKELLNEHFLYEIDMMESVIKYRSDLMRSEIDKQFAENIIVEILTLHARNLFEFFYKDKIEQEYATASQFMKGGKDWSKLRPNLTESLKILQKRVHVEVAHLTYKRIAGKPVEKLWNLKTLYEDMMNVACIFLDNVPEEYFDGGLKKFRERFCN